ncbi:dehydrogenase/reductase SDR family member 4-like [Pleurodeles waltl]|uniref:dehydrogenase/reductase SDR family member 4-like n=1 Tax=Pleurodeles waltl TaxID=8319 RepID=UPI0037095D48
MLTVTRGRTMFTSSIKSHGINRLPALMNLRGLLRMNSSAVDWNTVHAGKVAVMSASTEGIGLAVARRLAQQGASVVLSSREQKNVDKAIEQLKSEKLSVSGIVCNVTNRDHRKNLVEMALEKHGRIDYLFSNAAMGLEAKSILDTTEEEWAQVLHTNVTSMFLLVKQVLPHMQKIGGGSIVLTSSAAAYAFVPYFGAYCVSKTALAGLTKILASELSPMNIRLNSLAPGVTRTKMNEPVWTNEALMKDLIKVYGFQRISEPEEHAGIVSFLFSSDASYLTGETIVVGGGFRSRL